MRITQAELDLIMRGKAPRRMMRVPVQKRRPVTWGHTYKLKAAGEFVRITVLTLREEPLDTISVRDARREGHSSTHDALKEWARAHGQPLENQRVWVIGFARGDHTKHTLQDEPLLLTARSGTTEGDYTKRRDKAMRGELEPVGASALDEYALKANARDLAEKPPRTERDRRRERQQAKRRWLAQRVPSDELVA